MFWIQFESTVFDHRKTLRLSVLLGVRETHLVGHLGRLWTWALASAPTGELGQLEAAVIARAADWTGELLEIADADGFVAGLLSVGFLDRLEDGGLRLHGWRERHELWAARRESEQRIAEDSETERKRRHAESQASYRARKREGLAGDRPRDGGVTDGDSSGDRAGDLRVIVGDPTRDRSGVTGDRGVMSPVIAGDITGDAPDRTGPEMAGPGAYRTGSAPPAPRTRGERGSKDEGVGGMVAGAPWPPPLLDADPEAARIWAATLVELRLGMSQANYEAYLVESGGVAFDGEELTVAVSNPLVRETLEQRFRQHIARAALDVVGRPCRVRLVSGRARAPTTELVAAAAGGPGVNGHGANGRAERLEDLGHG